jgi:hypothetical protein
MGGKVLKGNTNNPSSFESIDISGAYSFVIHQNGDIRVALSHNGNYAHYLHDHTQPWTSGWSIYDSGTPDAGGLLVLQNNVPYEIRLLSTGIWLQKEFEAPVLLAEKPSGSWWKSITRRWSFYNDHSQGIIDIGTKTWTTTGGNYYWYLKYTVGTSANFTATPVLGIAPLTVNFSDSSSVPDGKSIVSWAWDFENDGTIDSYEQNPSHTYHDAGLYAVSLTVTDSDGSQNKAVKQDYVNASTDTDGDGIPDYVDNCKGLFNPPRSTWTKMA